MKLADELGIVSYPSPAGGCLLTDRNFSDRVRDLIDHEGLSMDAIELLKVGRHFRAPGGSRIVVGRNEVENDRMRALLRPGDVLVEPVDFKGPDGLVRGDAGEGAVELACGLVVRHSKTERGTCRVSRDGVELARLECAGTGDDVCGAARVGSLVNPSAGR